MWAQQSNNNLVQPNNFVFGASSMNFLHDQQNFERANHLFSGQKHQQQHQHQQQRLAQPQLKPQFAVNNAAMFANFMPYNCNLQAVHQSFMTAQPLALQEYITPPAQTRRLMPTQFPAPTIDLQKQNADHCMDTLLAASVSELHRVNATPLIALATRAQRTSEMELSSDHALGRTNCRKRKAPVSSESALSDHVRVSRQRKASIRSRKKRGLASAWSEISSILVEGSNADTDSDIAMADQTMVTTSNVQQQPAVHTLAAIVTKKSDKRMTCSLCEFTSSQMGHLNAHLRRKHKFSKHICHTCNFSHDDKLAYFAHMKTHCSESDEARRLRYRCNVCHYSTNKKSHLEGHVRTHKGLKSFQCDSCEYKCDRRHHLTIHMRQHTGEKPIQCELCDYKCSDNSSLTYHIRTKH